MRDDDATTVDLILEERPFLQRLAESRASQTADAEDLVQETVLRAYRSKDRFRPGSCMRAWLATILTRQFLTSVKTRRRRSTSCWTDVGVEEVQEDRALVSLNDASCGPGADFASVEQQVDDRVRRAMISLPPRYRDPFCMHVLQDLPYAAIARRLGVPVGTVMSRIFRARARLRVALGEPATPALRAAS